MIWLSGWLSWRAPLLRRAVCEDVLSDVTATAMELIPGVDTAGVLLIAKGGKFETLASTSDLPHQARRTADEVQRGAVRGGGRSTI